MGNEELDYKSNSLEFVDQLKQKFLQSLIVFAISQVRE
jgi:hypothetical protein